MFAEVHSTLLTMVMRYHEINKTGLAFFSNTPIFFVCFHYTSSFYDDDDDDEEDDDNKSFL